MALIEDARTDRAAAPERERGRVSLVEGWLSEARLRDDGSRVYRDGIGGLGRALLAIRPSASRLLANYPNPFNPETWIPFDLSEAADVSIAVYDMEGRVVRRLDLGRLPVGRYRARGGAAYWDGRTSDGEHVASGVYVYELRAGEFVARRRLVIRK